MNDMRLKIRTVNVLTVVFLLCSSLLTAFAQSDFRQESYAIFVSQRGGAAELYLLNLATRQVSQLTDTGRGHLAPALAANARQVVFAALAGSNYELFTATVSANWRTRRPLLLGMNQVTVNTTNDVSPSLSANGALLAFTSTEGLEVMAADGRSRRLLLAASAAYRNFNPVIAPDGQQVAFISDRSGTDEIWLVNTTSRAVRQLTGNAQVVGGLSWSADGQQIVFTTSNTETKLSGVALLNVATGGFRVLSDKGDSNPALAPTGNRLLFTSLRDGDPELYLLNLATGATERLTNSAGLDDGAVFVAEPGMPSRRP